MAKKGGPIDRHGYDAGKKINGKKRHLLLDTEDFAAVRDRAADIQDRAGGVLLMASLFGLFPFPRKLYADGGYQGPVFRKALARVMRCGQAREPMNRLMVKPMPHSIAMP